MQRRHHYERAFEAYLRSRRVPYVAVDEARKALLPLDGSAGPSSDIKSFDFVIYGPDRNLLVDVKGRKVVRRAARPSDRQSQLGLPPMLFGAPVRTPRGRLESWVTDEDVRSLQHWQALFGAGFHGALAFVYWCDEQPADGLFQEVFEHEGRWYALRTVDVSVYARHSKPRSAKWGTVDIPTRIFERISSAGLSLGAEAAMTA